MSDAAALKLAAKKQLHMRILMMALSVAPEALEKTKQFTAKEIAVFKTAKALGAEGRYADAAKVLAQRGMMGRLQEMVEGILSLGNKAIITEVMDMATMASEQPKLAAANGRRRVKRNSLKTAWVVSYRGRNVRFPWHPNMSLDEIYRSDVKPFLKGLEKRGVDLDDVTIVDATDLEQQDR